MNPNPSQAPVFFISHGAPTFALDPGLLGPQLGALGRQLAGVKAVLVVSPHWQTRELTVMSTPAPETVHDFGGFPAALYDLHYAAPGQPHYAAEAGRLLSQAGWHAGFDAQRGLDHGAWVPLMHLLPAADVPVFQVSMPHTLDTAGALRLGQTLAPLRKSGVMIVGSGGMTHNLYEFRQAGARQEDYALEFTHWVRQAVMGHDIERLLAYRQLAPHAQRAHPTQEHFLPLLVALGARTEGETAQPIAGGISHSVLSMESYVWGLAGAARTTVSLEPGATA